MELSMHPSALAFLVSGLLAILLAAGVVRVRPDVLQNRLLAVALAAEGGVFVWVGLTWAASTPAEAYAARVVNHTLAWFWISAYPAFLGTIRSPLARPFASPTARLFVFGVGSVGALSVVLRPDWYLLRVVRNPIGAFDVEYTPGYFLVYLAAAVFLYGLAVAFTAYRIAPPGSLVRKRAFHFLVAFGVRDIGMMLSFFLLRTGWSGEPAGLVVVSIIQTGSVLLFAGLLGLGILRAQLFDIDLKIKWTLKRSTLVALFVAFFFVVSELATVVFAERMGTVLGIFAAGLLLFAIAPLQRLADRIADVTMPQVEDTPAYRSRRQEEVYRGAIEELLADGAITVKERKALFRLRRDLGLDASQAIMIEERLLEARPSAEEA